MSRALASESRYVVTPVLDPSVSAEAHEVREALRGAGDSAPSITVDIWTYRIAALLKEAVDEAQKQGWDGYEARPCDPRTRSYALQFLSYLPLTMPLPEIAVDTDGEIAIEWDFGPRRIFSVTVGRDGTLHFAGLDAIGPFSGTEVLREDIQGLIWAGIERVVGASDITEPGLTAINSEIGVCAERQIPLEQEFHVLAERWHRETRLLSSVTQMVLHPAYQRIIGMGRDAIPLILHDLEETRDHWLWALEAITGENPVLANASFSDAVNSWLTWGRDHGFLT